MCKNKRTTFSNKYFCIVPYCRLVSLWEVSELSIRVDTLIPETNSAITFLSKLNFFPLLVFSCWRSFSITKELNVWYSYVDSKLQLQGIELLHTFTCSERNGHSYFIPTFNPVLYVKLYIQLFHLTSAASIESPHKISVFRNSSNRYIYKLEY